MNREREYTDAQSQLEASQKPIGRWEVGKDAKEHEAERGVEGREMPNARNDMGLCRVEVDRLDPVRASKELSLKGGRG